MDDLISRKALMKYMRDYKWEFALNSDFSKAIEMVDVQPTVEAKEVVHGEWVRTKFASEYICSNCQALTYAELTRTGYKNFNFCPNCGADMRTSAE